MDEIKLCKDCRHYSGNCMHQFNMKRSMVTGEISAVNSPSYLRDAESRCGREARWFEPREGK